MKRTMLLPLVLASVTPAMLMAAPNAGTSWTIKDTVEYEYFIEAQNTQLAGFDMVKYAQPIPSPDGSRFFVVKAGADIAANVATYDLLVFDAAQVSSAIRSASASPPAPIAAHRVHSRNQPASEQLGIMYAYWSVDSRSVTFVRMAEDGVRQLYRFDVESNSAQPLTAVERGVLTFRDFGSKVYFSAVHDHRPLKRSDIQAEPFYFLRDQEWKHLFEVPIESYQSYVRHEDGTTRALGEPTIGGGWASNLQDFFPSPNHTKVVIKKGLSNGVREKKWARWPHQDRLIFNGWTFFLADPNTGNQKHLLGVPTGGLAGNFSDSVPLWKDDRYVILVNTMVPLEDDRASVEKAYIVEVDTETDRYTIIDEMPEGWSASARWLKEGEQFVLYRPSEPATGVVYSRRGKGWKKESLKAPVELGGTTTLAGGVAVEIKLDDRGRQRLLASLEGRTIDLYPLNAAFAARTDSVPRTIEWKDRTGATWSGKLYLPPGAQAGKSLPVIVEPVAVGFFPHGFSPEIMPFIPGMPNQALAAEGFAVLHLDVGNDRVKTVTPEELPAVCDGYDSAMRKLASDGVIDPKRIGVVGFSRTGFYTFNILRCESQFKPAAGVMLDSYDGSYYRHIFDLVVFSKSIGGQTDTLHGGSFWDNREAWMERAPGFNLHKMESPFLVADFYGPRGSDWLGGAIGIMERYAGFRARNVPIEVVQFHASHVLTRPVDRLETMQLVRDWMQFWLNGVENPDPRHADRIRHWRQMREEWQQSKANRQAQAAASKELQSALK